MTNDEVVVLAAGDCLSFGDNAGWGLINIGGRCPETATVFDELMRVRGLVEGEMVIETMKGWAH